LPVIFPIHPRARRVVEENGMITPDNVRVIEPVGYLDMLALEEAASCILTDSGGVQKEAYWLGVRCITLHEETEWVETVSAGWNRLAGADPAVIVSAVETWFPKGERPALYGDGHAAEKIGQILSDV
jgi:UDP-N-acetylglucosamine 2-epimerase